MVDDVIKLKVVIPPDEEGYVLLQCPKCSTFFKAIPSDITDDEVLRIFCPGCGLTSDCYFTDAVLDLATKMVKNRIVDKIFSEFGKFDKKSLTSHVTFKVGTKPIQELEAPFYSKIDDLSIVHFSCCKRSAKVDPLLIMTGCYCVFCGEMNYEFE